MSLPLGTLSLMFIRVTVTVLLLLLLSTSSLLGQRSIARRLEQTILDMGSPTKIAVQVEILPTLERIAVTWFDNRGVLQLQMDAQFAQEATDSTINFILAHEAAHIQHGHHRANRSFQLFQVWGHRVTQVVEMQADITAARHVGQRIAQIAMLYLVSLRPDSLDLRVRTWVLSAYLELARSSQKGE